jgi:hypothetical protein
VAVCACVCVFGEGGGGGGSTLAVDQFSPAAQQPRCPRVRSQCPDTCSLLVRALQ